MKKLKSKKAIRRAKFLDILFGILLLVSVVSGILSFLYLICEENPDVKSSVWEFFLTKMIFVFAFGGVSGISGYIAYAIYSALSEFEY